MFTMWIDNCELRRIGLRDGLVLDFEDYNELVITGPVQLTIPPVGRLPGEVVSLDPLAVADYQRPLFDFSGATCVSSEVDDDGTLRVEFSSGHRVEVRALERRPAWELYGKRHGFMVCLPGGRVHVVRHDVEEVG